MSNLRATLDGAIQTLYAARRPITRKRRLSSGLSDQETVLLDSIEAALDILELADRETK